MKPHEKDAAIIERILEDIETLQKRVDHFGLTKERFCNDLSFEGEIAYDAVMNPLYRIVEDAVHLSDAVVSAYPECSWKEIRGFRNFIAHGYSAIDRGIAWGVIENDVPKLKRVLVAYIGADQPTN
ncbi:HepT-like ribonuclease domain-containing protein [Raoultibacter phocaeensis]|uniref:HepT-like ribonuclease domain-containing protein n=1 Tax=Raoultibacter phocaeensis TaxID=2479841 RepID=UPI001117F468|nr:HepT-like ribonuclease domain-containing protein [Raoultibacter phocaeensis]